MKKEFLSTYTTYENTPVEQLPSNLPGRIELENHKRPENNFFKQLEEKRKELD